MCWKYERCVSGWTDGKIRDTGWRYQRENFTDWSNNGLDWWIMGYVRDGVRTANCISVRALGLVTLPRFYSSPCFIYYTSFSLSLGLSLFHYPTLSLDLSPFSLPITNRSSNMKKKVYTHHNAFQNLNAYFGCCYWFLFLKQLPVLECGPSEALWNTMIGRWCV